MPPIPLVENGKEPRAPLHVSSLIALPSDTKYGNLTLKFHKMVIRLDHANLRIEELNKWFENRNEMNKRQQFMTASDFSEGLHISEEIIFNLKKVIDELLTLLYLKHFYLKNGEYPNKLKIDSIGKLLTSNEMGLLDSMNEHLIFLNQINAISNAHKHSFLNTDYNLYEKHEPYVFALTLKDNNLTNLPEFYAVLVRNMVRDFNSFYKKILSELRGWQ